MSAVTRPPRICGCASGSTCPTTAPTSRAGRPSPGCARCRATLEDALATVLRLPPVARRLRRAHRHRRARPRPGRAPRRRPRRRRRDRGRSRPALTRWCAGSTASCRPTCAYAGAVEAAGGFDARFSALWRRYAYRIADRPELVDPLTRRHVLAWPRRARRRRDERGGRAPGRAARLRGVLQAARGRDHDPDAARARLGADRRRPRRGARSWPTPSATPWCARWSAAWWPSARGAGRRSGRRRCSPAGVRDPAVTVVPAARADAGGGRLPRRGDELAARARDAGAREAREDDP